MGSLSGLTQCPPLEGPDLAPMGLRHRNHAIAIKSFAYVPAKIPKGTFKTGILGECYRHLEYSTGFQHRPL